MNKLTKLFLLFVSEFLITFFVVFALLDRFDAMTPRGNNFPTLLIYFIAIIPGLFFIFIGWLNSEILGNSGWRSYTKTTLITLGIFAIWFLIFGMNVTNVSIPNFILGWYGCLEKTQNWCDLGVVWFPLTFGLGEAIIGTLIGVAINGRRIKSQQTA